MPYSEVDVVLIPKGGGLKAVGINAFWAIPPMIVLSAANNAFNTGESPLVDEEVWYTCGSFCFELGHFRFCYNGRRKVTEVGKQMAHNSDYSLNLDSILFNLLIRIDRTFMLKQSLQQKLTTKAIASANTVDEVASSAYN